MVPQPTFGGGVRSDASLAEQRATREESAMAYISHLAAPQGPLSPPSMTTLALYAHGVAPVGGVYVRTDGLTILRNSEVPAHVLTMLLPATRKLYWSESLLERVTHLEAGAIGRLLSLPASMFAASGWEAVVEPSPTLRFLLALAWVRWYNWRELTAEALAAAPSHLDAHLARLATLDDAWNPQAWHATGFAHISRIRDLWRGPSARMHARYVAYLWRLVTQLLLPHDRLDVQTARYLALSHVPALDAHKSLAKRARFHAVCEHAARLGLDIGRDGTDAWEHYVAHLADLNRVPRPLVRSRLDGDWHLGTWDAYRALAQQLLVDMPELATQRAETARTARLRPERLVPALMEPLSALGVSALIGDEREMDGVDGVEAMGMVDEVATTPALLVPMRAKRHSRPWWRLWGA